MLGKVTLHNVHTSCEGLVEYVRQGGTADLTLTPKVPSGVTIYCSAHSDWLESAI